MQALIYLPRVLPVAVATAMGLTQLSQSEIVKNCLEYAVTKQPIEIPIEERLHLRSQAGPVTINNVEPAANKAFDSKSLDNLKSENGVTGTVAIGTAAGAAGYWASVRKTVGNSVSEVKKRPIVVVAAVAGVALVGGAVYYAFSRSPGSPQCSSTPASTSADPQPTPDTGGPGGPSEPPSDDDDSEDESIPDLDRDILIPKNMMEDIIMRNGPLIWRALQQKLTRGKMGTVWRDPGGNFRIDAGSVVSKSPQHKTWHLQVNRNPPSAAVKNLLRKIGRGGTHKKLFWNAWNVDNPPQYDEWVKRIMDAFN